MSKNYFHKPIAVQAVKFTGTNADEIEEFAGEHYSYEDPMCCEGCSGFSGIEIRVRRGNVWDELEAGEYVVKFSDGFEIISEYEFERNYTDQPNWVWKL